MITLPQNFAIVSAEREEYGPNQNEVRSAHLRRALTDNLGPGAAIIDARGVFEGRPERSFIVDLGELGDGRFGVVTWIARLWDQHSVLQVWDGAASLKVLESGEVIPLGQWVQDDDAIARGEDRTEVDGSAYVCR